MRRHFDGLRPVDEDGRTAIRKLPLGEDVMVTWRRARNNKFHRKVFALLQLVFQNQDKYLTFKRFRAELQKELGYGETYDQADGKEIFVPDSLSFAAMDEDTFQTFWDDLCNHVLAQWLPTVTREELEDEILELTGAHPSHGQFGVGA